MKGGPTDRGLGAGQTAPHLNPSHAHQRVEPMGLFLLILILSETVYSTVIDQRFPKCGTRITDGMRKDFKGTRQKRNH
jgi:hypothetical protein